MRLRVLIVEDNPLVSMDMADAIQAAGADVVGVAESVEAALAVLDEMRPHIVFVDVGLRGAAPGYQIVETARAGTAFVFITGLPDAIPEDISARWPVLEKPITSEELRAVLAYVSERGSPTSDSSFLSSNGN